MSFKPWVLAIVVAGFVAISGDVNAGGRQIYRGRAAVRGADSVIYARPLVTGPSSMYAYPTASEYIASPLYNPYQHPLLPAYGIWPTYSAYAFPMDGGHFGYYGESMGFPYGW